MSENIFERPPILFGDGSKKSEYLEKQKRATQSLLEATESNTVNEFLVKLIYGEDFFLPARLLDTKIEASGRGCCREGSFLQQFPGQVFGRSAQRATQSRTSDACQVWKRRLSGLLRESSLLDQSGKQSRIER